MDDATNTDINGTGRNLYEGTWQVNRGCELFVTPNGWCQGNELILEEYTTVHIGCFISMLYSVWSEGKFAVTNRKEGKIA